MAKIELFPGEWVEISPNEWNDDQHLEAMDRCHTIIIMTEQLLDKHPIIFKLPDGQKRVDTIMSMLNELYQDIGKL